MPTVPPQQSEAEKRAQAAQERSDHLRDAWDALIDAAWAVEDAWWPDSPHTKALLAVLNSVESALLVLDKDS